MPDIATRRRFLLFLVKPSHYDDEGYVIQWWKSALPSNSLACLFGIAQKCMEDQVLGEDVAIEIFPVDETNTRVRPVRIARQIQDNGGFGMVGFRRRPVESVPARDGLREAAAGGRSAGSDRRVPRLGMPFDAEDPAARSRRGAEPGHQFLRRGSRGSPDRRSAAGRVFRFAEADLQPPRHDSQSGGRTVPTARQGRDRQELTGHSSFDLGRGCPFECSFCTIINVQGRKSRFRTPDDLEAIVRANAELGIRDSFSPTTILPATSIGRYSSTA